MVRILIVGFYSLGIVLLVGTIIIVNYTNRKKTKNAAIRKEIQAHKARESEGKYIYAPYIPLTKQVADRSTFCPRCGGLSPVCPC